MEIDNQKRKTAGKILVVDDDQLTTEFLEMVLVENGHVVVKENNSNKALEVALKELPDLICLDLMMPQPDGFKLTRMMRAQPALRRTPIIIITALDDTDSRIVGIGAGANEYLTKPFYPDDLYKKIRDLLHGKELGLFDSD